MAFPLKDVRFTTRRAGGVLNVYPRLLRDRAMLPRIDVAAQYFESMLGRERRLLDAETLVTFFGDHKQARCLVACLTIAYRYRPRAMEEIVTRTALRRLQRAEADNSIALRLRLYDRLNDFGHGFLPHLERAATLDALEAELALRGGELETLLYLDAAEHAVLTRVGARPVAEDVAAQYNFGALQALLRHAEQLELTLTDWSPHACQAALTLCSANGVAAELEPTGRGISVLRLRGRQDALGSWLRHGRALARSVVQLLERARPSVSDGLARVSLRDRRGVVRLTAETLNMLIGPSNPHAATADEGWTDLDGWDVEALASAIAASRSAGDGVRMRRAPEPRAWAAGVVVPDLLMQVGPNVALVCAVRSLAHAERLARIAPCATSGEPLLFVGDPDALAPLMAVDAWTLAVSRFDPRAIAESLRPVHAEQPPSTRRAKAVARVA